MAEKKILKIKNFLLAFLEEKTYCSFCGKSIDQVKIIINGQGVHICNNCVRRCARILKEDQGKQIRPPIENIENIEE